MRIAFASTPVGALGSGNGGGVELTIQSLANGLARLGHSIEVFAPSGSVMETSNQLGTVLHQVDGTLQQPAQDAIRSNLIVEPEGSVLKNMWAKIRAEQAKFDVVLNFAYDALPLRLTGQLDTAIAHLISMASLTDAMDQVIVETSLKMPGSIAMHSNAQAATFIGLADSVRIVGGGIETEEYIFNGEPNGPLGFVGRISSEKGFEDAVMVAERTQVPLSVWGLMQDKECFSQALAKHPKAIVNYKGFVANAELGKVLGQCRALLVTSKWVEAFGNVVIEALACGTPVIAYRRGGPAEIVNDGQTGFVVAADDVEQMSDAVRRVGEIDRAKCRQSAETYFSAGAFCQRVEKWLLDCITSDG